MDDAIKAYFESLHEHKRYVLEAGLMIGGIPEERLVNHDASKFTEAEYPYYARQFHGDKGDPAGFARAWLHHIHHNDHHWNHWLFGDDFHMPGAGIEGNALPMPEAVAREMIADWMGASRAYTGSWEMTDWLNQHLPDRIILHSESRQIVYAVLAEIGYEQVGGSRLVMRSPLTRHASRITPT